MLWGGTRDHMVGEFAKCYVITDRGVEYFESEQIDPRTGKKCNWVKPEEIPFLNALHKKILSGKPLQRVEFSRVEDVQFFEVGTAFPKVWYHRQPGGKFELFDGPGVHPIFGVWLDPITPTAASEWLQTDGSKFKEDPAAMQPEPSGNTSNSAATGNSLATEEEPTPKSNCFTFNKRTICQ
jgi:hypothetical protein